MVGIEGPGQDSAADHYRRAFRQVSDRRTQELLRRESNRETTLTINN
jgi:hypothetical protein